MVKKIHGILIFAALTFIPFSQVRGEGRFELPDGLVVRPQAYGHLTAGQVVHGNVKFDDKNFNSGVYEIAHVWTQNAVVNLGFQALYNEHLKIVCMVETKLYFSYPQFLTDELVTKNMRQDVALEDVYAQVYLGEEAQPDFYGQVGYFKFKYNPDVRNLGEYLFRTGTYPAFIDNGFDFPMRRLLGFHAHGNILNRSLKGDLFLVSATVFPAMNWSLAGIASYDILGLHVAEIGAGIMQSHLFDIYNKFSTASGNPTMLDPDKNVKYIKETKANSTGGLDTTYDYYTFKGTNVMGRLNIDPKAFIPIEFFGKDDLKMYAEFCVIGWKNYPDSGYPLGSSELTLVAPSYNNRMERTPIVVGFNIPMFTLLDVLNIEFEFNEIKYCNDASRFLNKGSVPLPNYLDPKADPDMPEKSKLYWSIYAKKSFFDNHFAIILQCAHDHMRLSNASYNKEYWNDLLVAKEDWWWAFKTSWNF